MILYSNKGKYLRKKKIGIIGWAIRVFLIILAISVLALGGTALHHYHSQRQYEKLAQAVHATDTVKDTQPKESTASTETTPSVPTEGVTEPSTEPTTVPETEPQPLLLYVELHGENPDYFGWLQIQDTKVDYPVMHTPDDPEKYLHTSFEGEYFYGGTPFLDHRCNPNSDNLVIYGHNMMNGTMFRDILKYEKEAYWQEHPTIRLATEYEDKEYEILAVFRDRVYRKSDNVFKFYNFIDAEDEAAYYDAIANFKAKAIYDTGVEPEYGDQLITLVTCAYHTENGRFVVVACEKNGDSAD